MNEDLKMRLGGAACFAGGLLIGWLAILKPYQEALKGYSEISLSWKGAFIVGPLILFGLFLLIMGKDGESRLRKPEEKKLTLLGIVVFGICIAAGFAGMLGTQYLVEQLGYHSA